MLQSDLKAYMTCAPKLFDAYNILIILLLVYADSLVSTV